MVEKLRSNWILKGFNFWGALSVADNGSLKSVETDKKARLRINDFRRPLSRSARPMKRHPLPLKRRRVRRDSR